MASELEEALDRLNTRLLLNANDSWTRYNQARTQMKK